MEAPSKMGEYSETPTTNYDSFSQEEAVFFHQ